MGINRKLRMGMIGGSEGAFIGDIHRKAAIMDSQIELVCGVFSASPERSWQTGRKLYLPENRIYDSYQEMIIKEKNLPDTERMDFVSIVTPNNQHFQQAKFALENGFHVVCDKPMTANVGEALELGKLVKETGLVFMLTHNYTGYPMVKQAREMARGGALGVLRKVVVEYPQGWLATLMELTGHKQAAWRSDPEITGNVLTMGDVGTHAENLIEYITGLEVSEVNAELSTLVSGRKMDDDDNILLRFSNGARGVLIASQVSAGEENNLKIKVYGEKGGLEWAQMEPSSLIIRWTDKPIQIIRSGNNSPELSEIAKKNCRLPAGHPEGFIEAFANIYLEFGKAVKAHISKNYLEKNSFDFPDVNDGIRGMAFIRTVLESTKSREKWIPFVNPAE
jgi:predicted dehydrogenase